MGYWVVLSTGNQFMGIPRKILTTTLVLVGLGWSHLGHAATNIVSSLNDGLTAGTLRFAIANSLPGDVVVFSNGLAGVISLTNGGALLVDKNLTIQGPGAKVITVSGNNSNRVFTITNATVDLSGLTIANGRVLGTNGGVGSVGQTVFGAGILNLHSIPGFRVTVTDCAFIQNSAAGGNGGGTGFGGGAAAGDAYGAAILNNANLALAKCCLAGNFVTGGKGGDGPAAGGKGGAALGAAIWNVGLLTLTNCTFATNTAIGGVGGNTGGGPGSLSFPGSGGNGEGAGLYNAGQLVMISCTIASNLTSGGNGGSGGISGSGIRGGAYGGGVRAASGTSEMANTIIAANLGAQARDVSGVFNSRGYNLAGTTNGSTGFGVVSDQTGNTNNPINPGLGPLQGNGGQTPSFALQTSSPAIDNGQSFGLSGDQRGAPRPSDFPSASNLGDGSDIGAYEVTAPLLDISRSPGHVLLSWSAFIPGYALESTTNLASGNWNSVGIAPVMIGNWYYVTNSISISGKFFRLHSP
jgi:hypothetical protein